MSFRLEQYIVDGTTTPRPITRKVVIKDDPDICDLQKIILSVAIYRLLNPKLKIEYEVKNADNIVSSDIVVEYTYQKLQSDKFHELVKDILDNFTTLYDKNDIESFAEHVKNMIYHLYGFNDRDLLMKLKLNFGFQICDRIHDKYQQEKLIDFVLHYYRTYITDELLRMVNDNYVNICCNKKQHPNIVICGNIDLNLRYTSHDMLNVIRNYNEIKYVIYSISDRPDKHILIAVNGNFPYRENFNYSSNDNGELGFDSFDSFDIAWSFALRQINFERSQQIRYKTLQVLKMGLFASMAYYLAYKYEYIN
jgi:hypothetical protein